MLIVSSYEDEVRYISEYAKHLAVMETDEKWNFHCCCNEKQLSKAVLSEENFDLVCMDMKMENAFQWVENLRRMNPNMYLIMISDNSIHPEEYVTPSILNSGLIVRPVKKDNINQVIKSNVRAYLKRFYSDDRSDCFVLDSKEGRQFIPYNIILYFESREKKIALYTDKNEYAFYDTLENLEKILPEEKFIRCHRSYIVRKDKIDSISLSKNLIILDSGEMLPVSRTYKSQIKELR